MTIDDLKLFLSDKFGSTGQSNLFSNEGDRIEGITAEVDKTFRFKDNAQIVFENCHFKKLVIESECNCKFLNCTFDELNIKKGTISLELISSKNCTLFIAGTSDVRLHKCEINRIFISDMRYGKLDFSIVNCVMLSLTGQFDESTTKLYEMVCSRLEFSKVKLQDSAKLFLSQIKVDLILLYNDSDLNKAEFDSCDFSSAYHFIQTSTFGQVSYFNMQWFKKIYTSKNNFGRNVHEHVAWMAVTGDITGDKLESEIAKGINFREFYEGYREYKAITGGSKNRPDEIYFKAKEYNAKLKQLPWKWTTFSDRVVLFLNKISNNHGQFWFIPVLWLLGISAVFYFLFVWSLNGTCGFSDSFNHYSKNWVNIFLFINPTHSLDSMLIENASLTNNAKLIDWSFRVISAYLLFQTVMAFRKFKE